MEVHRSLDSRAPRPPVTISDLPNEILIEVLSRLSASDLATNARGVCRSWRQLAVDCQPWAFRSLLVAPRKHMPLANAERRLLKKTPALRSLTISLRRMQDLPLPLPQLMSSCRRLRRLHLTLPFLTRDFAQDITSHWPGLQDLSIDATKIDPEALDQISGLQHLTRLEVSTLEEDVWTPLMNLSNCKTLRSLNVNARCLDEAKAALVVDVLKDRLTALSLGTLVPATEHLFSTISKCSRLVSLSVTDCSRLTDNALISLTADHNMALQTISFHSTTALTSTGLHSFLHRANLSELDALDLTGCFALTNNILRFIKQRCPGLSSIVVEQCPRVTQDMVNYLWSTREPQKHLSERSLETTQQFWNSSCEPKQIFPSANIVPPIHLQAAA